MHLDEQEADTPNLRDLSPSTEGEALAPMPSPDIQPSPFKKKPRGGMARLAGWATGRFAVTTKEPKEEERPPDRIIRRSSAEEAHVEAGKGFRVLIIGAN